MDEKETKNQIHPQHLLTARRAEDVDEHCFDQPQVRLGTEDGVERQEGARA